MMRNWKIIDNENDDNDDDNDNDYDNDDDSDFSKANMLVIWRNDDHEGK